MQEIRNKLWKRLFGAIAFLVLLQITWWTTLFMRDVNMMAELRHETLLLHSHIPGSHTILTKDRIDSEAFHRRFMFLSESIFFSMVTCLGLWLLYRALRAEEKSRDIQKNFIEIMSHESKTPITALKLRLESLVERSPTDVALAKDLSLALEEVRRLSSIFDKAMSLNRMERHALTFEALPLAEVVKQVTRRLEPLFRARKVEVELDLDGEAIVRGDSYGLQNSVQSLLENAVLYNHHAERRVLISVRSNAPKVVLGISDNGPGIPAADREHIFERFYRGHTGKGVPGTGLGLYIARSIIEAHQGALRLVEQKDRGSKFEIELPLSPEVA